MNEKRKFHKVLFVGTSNTCRSPMAEILFRSYQGEREDSLEIHSRGLIVLFPEPCNPKASMVLSNHNLELSESYRSRQLKPKDMTDYTLILTMTQSQKTRIIEEFGNHNNIYTISEFAGEEGDVIDPYGGDLLDYESCFVNLHRLVKKTVYKVIEELE